MFLTRFAVKNMKLGLSRTWVLPVVADERQSQKAHIAAYYSLASSTVMKEEIPYDKNLPSYPVPVVLLARLAVDEQFKEQRLGEKTLITALRKSVESQATRIAGGMRKAPKRGYYSSRSNDSCRSSTS